MAVSSQPKPIETEVTEKMVQSVVAGLHAWENTPAEDTEESAPDSEEYPDAMTKILLKKAAA